MVRLLAAALFLLSMPSTFAAAQVVLPDKAGDFKNGVYHSGFVVADIDTMAEFLGAYSSLRVRSRVALPNGGERAFLEDARGQRVELLSDPKAKALQEPRPQYPRDSAIGLAHLAIEVEDAAAVRERILAEGYTVIFQVPKDFADGYIVSEVDAHRVLFIEGPSGVAIEFFEIEKRH